MEDKRYYTNMKGKDGNIAYFEDDRFTAVKENLVTKDELAAEISKIEVPTKVSELENDAHYLTEHQDISGKANAGDVYTKAEIDSKGYLTEHQDLSGYVTLGAYNELLAQLKAVSPKKVILQVAEGSKIDQSKIKIYRHDTDIEPSAYVVGTELYARDGDFGYPTIDNSGQINFSLSFLDSAEYRVSAEGSGYNKFKNPYLTMEEGRYRFTQISKDTTITLSTEEDIGGTYSYTVPEDLSMTIIEYRNEDCAKADFKGLEVTGGVGNIYNKDTGYKCEPDGSSAQVNIVCKVAEIPEGKKIKLTVTSGSFNKIGLNGTELPKGLNVAEITDTTFRIKLTKVSKSPTLTFELIGAVNE